MAIKFLNSVNADSGVLYVDAANDRVGIGTTSPAYKLDISGGDIRINKSDARLLIGWQLGSGGIQLEGGGSTASTLYFKSDRFRFYTDSAQEIVSLTQAGNVGIGDTTPQAKLHIQTSGGSTTAPNTVLLVQANTSTTTLAGGGTAILFKGVSSGGNIQNYEQGRIRTFGYATNNAHGFAIDVKPSASNGLTEALSLASNGVLKLPYYGAGYLKTDANGVVSVDSDTIEDTLDSVTTRGNTTTNAITVGGVDSNGGVTITRSASNTQLKLKRTTSATGEFNIYTNSDSLYFQNVGQSTYPMVINSSGNVGIGATSPGSTLHVDGTVRFVNSGFAGFEAHNTNDTWESFIGTETGGGGNRYNSASSQHTFYNNSTAVMRIDSSGNVGIGSTSPRDD